MAGNPHGRKLASVIALPWLCAAGALFAGMWARKEWDDWAGWVPAIVAFQIAWCVLLGRPAKEVEPWRVRVLKGWAGLMIGATWIGVIVAVVERVAWWAVFPIVLLVAPAVNYLVVKKGFARRAPDRSTAGTNVGLLMSVTASAVMGGGVAAACLWTTPADAGMLAGLAAALVLFVDVVVLVWCVGPWLWTLAVRLPADGPLPAARVVRDGR